MSLGWTEADQAELELLIAEFVDVAALHYERCLICERGQPWCRELSKAFSAVQEWLERRKLQSRAAHLRAREDLAAA